MMYKILFALPTTLLNLILPYKASTETEREMSQYMRNKQRLLTYKAKRIITPR